MKIKFKETETGQEPLRGLSSGVVWVDENPDLWQGKRGRRKMRKYERQLKAITRDFMHEKLMFQCHEGEQHHLFYNDGTYKVISHDFSGNSHSTIKKWQIDDGQMTRDGLWDLRITFSTEVQDRYRQYLARLVTL